MNVRRELESRLGEAMTRAGAAPGSPARVQPAGRPEFGDYQANGVMGAAKRLKIDPRRLAEKTVAAAELSDLAETVEVAGPGFVNVRLKDAWLCRRLAAAAADERLGVPPADAPQTVVVDYSHPNLAKEMHVGHLRSTIIGDAIVRVLAFLGHRVIRHNHVGDWGTQFGMLLAHMDDLSERGGRDVSAELADLEAFYQAAKRRFDEDADFAARARRVVVRLQSGDAHCRAVWRRFIRESLRHCERVYERLGVTLTGADVRPESAYNDDLPKVVEDLQAAGLLTVSDGARCVFLPEFTGRDGQPLPAIVQKSDGAYLYATTDLAAARYRANVLGADRILYVVDARQSLHLRQVFAIARAAGFVPEGCSLEHIAFGTMLGPGGTPFRTREGRTVKLMDLLAEADQRALALVTDKSPHLPAEQRWAIARAVGVGAVKYADLSQNRTSDYVFSWDRMLSLEGNTAPYMQYAYARVRSIFRKGAGQAEAGQAEEPARPAAADAIRLIEPAERTLAVRLLQLPETVELVAGECLPSVLCAYLYDVAGAFMGFYETCPVLKAAPAVRASRLALCDLTARTIRTGLGLLGIAAPERM
jgi:arginyl-tRNA synthetase